jgi:hypothetical protein
MKLEGKVVNEARGKYTSWNLDVRNSLGLIKLSERLVDCKNLRNAFKESIQITSNTINSMKVCLLE